LEAARLERLQQVRGQASQIAKSRSRAYERLCVQSAESLQQQLRQLLIDKRDRELTELKAEYEQALAGMAAAQRHAAATEQQVAIERQQQHQLFLHRQQQALQRFAVALSKVHSARKRSCRQCWIECSAGSTSCSRRKKQHMSSASRHGNMQLKRRTSEQSSTCWKNSGVGRTKSAK